MQRTQAQPSQKTGLLGWVFRLKTMLIAVSFFGLLTSNLAAVLNASFHDLLFMGIQKAALILGSEAAERVVSRSKKVEIDERVRKETEALRKETAGANARAKDADAKRVTAETNLSAERANLNRVSSELDGVKGRINKMKPALQTRLKRGVSRNLVAIPAESLPFVGMGVVIAVTAADLKDACDTMKDFNTLLVELNRGEKDPDLCGEKVPSREELLTSMQTNGRMVYEKTKSELSSLQLDIPAFTMPSRANLCPVWIPGC